MQRSRSRSATSSLAACSPTGRTVPPETRPRSTISASCMRSTGRHEKTCRRCNASIAVSHALSRGPHFPRDVGLTPARSRSTIPLPAESCCSPWSQKHVTADAARAIEVSHVLCVKRDPISASQRRAERTTRWSGQHLTAVAFAYNHRQPRAVSRFASLTGRLVSRGTRARSNDQMRAEVPGLGGTEST